MTVKPQFEHKNPGLSEALPGLEGALRRRLADLYADLYNAAVFSCSTREAWTFKAWGNDVLSFRLTALLDRVAAAGSGPDQIRIRQMGIPQ
jgi:hypothetical protein